MKVKRKTMAQPQDLPLPLSMKLFLPCQVWNFSPLLLFTFFSPSFLKSFCLPSPLQRPLFITRGSPPLTAMYVGDDGEVELFFFFFFVILIFFFFENLMWGRGIWGQRWPPQLPAQIVRAVGLRPMSGLPSFLIHIDWRPCQLTGFQQFRLSFKWIVDHFIRDDSLMNWTKLRKVWSTEFKRNSLDFGIFVDTHILWPAESDLQNCDFSSP